MWKCECLSENRRMSFSVRLPLFPCGCKKSVLNWNYNRRLLTDLCVLVCVCVCVRVIVHALNDSSIQRETL